MKKIAITGNIASGKSQVEKILLSMGFKVIDTDKINHFILASDINAVNEIKNAFKNDDILDENGKLSREKLGKIIFSSKLKKVELEDILHKRIFEKINDFYNQNKNESIVFVSIPLLFEIKQEKNFDKIIFISADEDVRLRRLIKRNNYSENYAKIRINSQEKEESKIIKSDYVIYNNSDFINLKKQVNNVLSHIIN